MTWFKTEVGRIDNIIETEMEEIWKNKGVQFEFQVLKNTCMFNTQLEMQARGSREKLRVDNGI